MWVPRRPGIWRRTLAPLPGYGLSLIHISLFYTGVFAVAFALYAYGESETIRQFVRNTYLLYLSLIHI